MTRRQEPGGEPKGEDSEMTKQNWKPWHEVVRLRGDLRLGDLPLHMFAADLYEVMMQNGKRPIYERPEEFFALTFPTHNLRGLVRDVVLRLAGKNDKAVRQLELTYGGGKTHTLITMRHLVNDPANLPNVPAVREFTETIGQTLPQDSRGGALFRQAGRGDRLRRALTRGCRTSPQAAVEPTRLPTRRGQGPQALAWRRQGRRAQHTAS